MLFLEFICINIVFNSDSISSYAWLEGKPECISSYFDFNFADVQCPVLDVPKPPLISRIEGSRMGHSAVFECPVGYRLEGASSITCQYNGTKQWSLLANTFRYKILKNYLFIQANGRRRCHIVRRSSVRR